MDLLVNAVLVGVGAFVVVAILCACVYIIYHTVHDVGMRVLRPHKQQAQRSSVWRLLSEKLDGVGRDRNYYQEQWERGHTPRPTLRATLGPGAMQQGQRGEYRDDDEEEVESEDDELSGTWGAGRIADRARARAHDANG